LSPWEGYFLREYLTRTHNPDSIRDITTWKTRSLFPPSLSPQSVRFTQRQYTNFNLCHEPQDTHERPCM
jgi:hypothetical protein